jgi:rSAM/selenodomain-associated transferase 2
MLAPFRGSYDRAVISVVVPVSGEDSPSPEVLGPLREAGATELLVAGDAGTSPGVLAAWKAVGADLRVSSLPRGARLNEAARASRGDVLLFLHADTRLPEAWAEAVRKAVAAGSIGGAFRLAFSGGSSGMRFVAAMARLRTAITRVPYGDQAPFVTRDAFERLGGFSPWPLLEDVDFGRRLKREGPIALLAAEVATSPRRYEALGIPRAVVRNWSILMRWRLGASPIHLAREYRAKPASR